MCLLSPPSRKFQDVCIHLLVCMSIEDGIPKLLILLIVVLLGGSDYWKWVIELLIFILFFPKFLWKCYFPCFFVIYISQKGLPLFLNFKLLRILSSPKKWKGTRFYWLKYAVKCYIALCLQLYWGRCAETCVYMLSMAGYYVPIIMYILIPFCQIDDFYFQSFRA